MNRSTPYSQAQQRRNETRALRNRLQNLGTPWQWIADVVGGIVLIATIMAATFMAAVLLS